MLACRLAARSATLLPALRRTPAAHTMVSVAIVCAAKMPDPPGTMRCGICNNKFKDLGKLEKHLKIHTQEHNKRMMGNKAGKRVKGARIAKRTPELWAKEDRYQVARAASPLVEHPRVTNPPSAAKDIVRVQVSSGWEAVWLASLSERSRENYFLGKLRLPKMPKKKRGPGGGGARGGEVEVVSARSIIAAGYYVRSGEPPAASARMLLARSRTSSTHLRAVVAQSNHATTRQQ